MLSGLFVKKDSVRDFPPKTFILLSAVIGFAFAFTFVLFAIVDIFSLNHEEIPFNLSTALGIAVPIFLAVWLAVFLLLWLLSKKSDILFAVIASLVFGLVVSGYLQGAFLNSSVGELTGDEVLWEKLGKETVLNVFIWLVILIAPFVIRFCAGAKAWKFTVFAVCAVVCGMQATNLTVNLISTGAIWNKNLDEYLSDDKTFELSSQNNIIIFVVDRLDYEYVERVRRDTPGFFDRLDGFTEFTDAMSPYLRTYPAAAYITTGVPGYYDKTRKQFLGEAYGSSDFIRLLKDNDYTTKYHMTQGYAYYSTAQLRGVADNIVYDKVKTNWSSNAGTFFKLSRYRYAPLCLKKAYWLAEVGFPQDVQNHVRVEDDDPAFYQMLMENGLTVRSDQNNYMYIHLQGSHPPYVMDSNSMREDQGTSLVRQTKGVFNILFEYMDKMKELGLYENATIIITGDHGYSVDDSWLAHTPSIGLFIKPKGSAGTPLEQNSAQVSLENLLATILQSEGLEHAAFGRSAFDVPEGEEVVRPFWNLVNPVYPRAYMVEYFEISGYSRDIGNWNKIYERDATY